MGRQRIKEIEGQPPPEVIEVTGGGKYSFEHFLEKGVRDELPEGGLIIPDVPFWGRRRPSTLPGDFSPEEEEERLRKQALSGCVDNGEEIDTG